MKSPSVNLYLSLSLLWMVIACTKGIPQVTVGDKLPSVDLSRDGSTSARLSSLVVTDGEGQCPPEVIRISLRFDDEPWVDLKELDPAATLDCANVGTGTKGPFRFAFDFNKPLFSELKAKLLAGRSVIIKARGFSDLMMTEDGVMSVSLSASGSPSKIVLGSVRKQACTSNCAIPSTRLLSGQINFQAPSTGILLTAPSGKSLIGIIRSAGE